MSDSCQVDFYVLESATKSAERLACRLAMMAWEQGQRTFVLTESDDEAASLDRLMWERPAGRFLPHALAGNEAGAPVTIGTAESMADFLADAGGGVIINLTRDAVTEPGRFDRLLEIVPQPAAERAASRIKFRAYRELGLEPASHTIA